jgi:hypothetical protein
MATRKSKRGDSSASGAREAFEVEVRSGPGTGPRGSAPSSTTSKTSGRPRSRS